MPKKALETSEETKIALLQQDIGYIRKALEELDKKMDNLGTNFVTMAEFRPVRTIVYGMVALILTGVVGAVLALILR